MGWETVNTVKTPLAQTDFSSYIAPVLNSGADVLVLNHYGGNMVNSLTNAVQFGLRDKQVNGKKFEIVVPLYSELMAAVRARTSRASSAPRTGTGQLTGRRHQRLRQILRRKVRLPAIQAAHTCYVQTLLYADAVERAGTFNPCAVVEALEGFEFDGLGNGPTLYRAEDHQCFKDVWSCRARRTRQRVRPLEIVEVTPCEQVDLRAEHPMFAGGDLGECNPGA